MRPRALSGVIDSLVAAVPPTEWRPYLRWRLVLEMSGGIGGVRRATDDFMRHERHQERPRAIGCVLETTQWLADGVGQAFVARVFPPEARTAARELTETIRQVLRERVAALEWIGSASRLQMLAKLDSLKLWIGYPDRWQSYKGIRLRDGAPTNALTVRRFEMDRQLASIGKPVDRNSWTEANAAFADGSYYSNTNALLITAGELLPPFFDPRGEPAANFGKIGQVMGHELTHAMHSYVRLSSEAGPRDDAWTPDEVREFTRRATPLIEQYDGYLIVDSIHVNGRTTLQENIADIGGVTLAWLAYQRSIRGTPRDLIDGFTPEQRFFIAYAQSINSGVWGPEETRSQAQVDGFSHSAPRWRINGPLANLAAFAAAFGCKVGDPMVRPAALQWSVW
jgi:putative endopeptidase